MLRARHERGVDQVRGQIKEKWRLVPDTVGNKPFAECRELVRECMGIRWLLQDVIVTIVWVTTIMVRAVFMRVKKSEWREYVFSFGADPIFALPMCVSFESPSRTLLLILKWRKFDTLACRWVGEWVGGRMLRSVDWMAWRVVSEALLG